MGAGGSTSQVQKPGAKKAKVEAVAKFNTIQVKKKEPVRKSAGVSKKPVIKQVPADVATADVTFINTSRAHLYVFAISDDEETTEECYGEVGASKNTTLAVPSGGQFCLRDEDETMYFQTASNCSKTCIIPIGSTTMSFGNAGKTVTIKNTSTSRAVIREVSLQDGSKSHREAHRIFHLDPKQSRTLETRYPQTYRIGTEKGGLKIEIMASSQPQVYEIDKNFSNVKSTSTSGPEYTEAALFGFLVAGPEQLMDRKNYKDFWDALDLDLQEIARLVPKSVAKVMRRIALYVNIDNPGKALTGMCFHRGTSWLSQYGEPLEKYGAVEIRSVEEYLKLRAQNTACLLHEYAHGYHFFTYSLNKGLIEYTYEETLKKGQYMSLSLPKPHYCIAGMFKHSLKSMSLFIPANALA